MTHSAHSRCCVQRGVALVWARYRSQDGVPVVSHEIKAAFPDSMTKIQMVARWADMESLLELACAGELSRDHEAFDPVASQPDLWELRWSFDDGSEWRQYHAEPMSMPKHLLAMLFHRKDLTGSPQVIAAAQNLQMSEAQERYTEGEAWHWGNPGARTSE